MNKEYRLVSVSHLTTVVIGPIVTQSSIVRPLLLRCSRFGSIRLFFRIYYLYNVPIEQEGHSNAKANTQKHGLTGSRAEPSPSLSSSDEE